jgi:hypothetical protein
MNKKLSNAIKLKSKTINFNAFIVAIVAACKACDIDIPPDLVTAVTIIGNMALRFMTDKPLDTK